MFEVTIMNARLYNFLNCVWEEHCPWYLIIACWCVFALAYMTEMFLPVAFGYLSENVEMTFWFYRCGELLYIFDKLAIVLGVYSSIATYQKFAERK